jgi:hypothetical protein
MSSDDPSEPDLDAWIDAAAAALRLEILPQDRGAVLFNLALTLRHAALVETIALDDETEPAPVFVA